MPKRPVQHQIETRSRTLWERLIPDQWLFRPESPDYGIDGSIEIFDVGGAATGHRFLVQLKGTTRLSEGASPRVRLSREAGEYYASLELPVLVVLADVERDRLFVRWFHEFDPYYGGLGKKWITFPFGAEHAWGDDTISRLEKDVQAWRRSRAGALPLPIEFELSVEDPQIGGVPAPVVRTALREAVAPLRHLVSLRSDRGHFRIQISDDRAVVSLGGGKTATLHSRGNTINPDEYAADVVLLVGLVLSQAGEMSVASEVVTKVGDRSFAITQPEMGMMVAGILARAFRVEEALDLSRRLLERGDQTLIPDLLSLPAMMAVTGRSRSYDSFLERYSVWRVAHCEERGHGAGAAHSNLARVAHSLGQYRRAIRHFRAACKWDPGYAKRDFYWREMAAVLFDARRYRLSVSFYEEATRLRADEEWRALLADALLFAGRYADASAEFDRFLAATGEMSSEWRLKSWVLGGMRQLLQTNQQKRRPRAAGRIVDEAVRSGTPEPSEMRRALSEDGLCAIAWFNLGVGAAGREQDEAFVSFLIAALISRSDAEAWVNALVLSMQSEKYGFLMPYITDAAARALRREQFAVALKEWAKGQDPRFSSDIFLDGMTEAIDHAQNVLDAATAFEVRLIGDDGQYERLLLGASDEDFLSRNEPSGEANHVNSAADG